MFTLTVFQVIFTTLTINMWSHSLCCYFQNGWYCGESRETDIQLEWCYSRLCGCCVRVTARRASTWLLVSQKTFLSKIYHDYNWHYKVGIPLYDWKWLNMIMIMIPFTLTDYVKTLCFIQPFLPYQIEGVFNTWLGMVTSSKVEMEYAHFQCYVTMGTQNIIEQTMLHTYSN